MLDDSPPPLGASAMRVLVLDDSDSDFRVPPFEDRVFSFDAEGKPVTRVTGLNTTQSIGGSRAFCVSPDGKYFVVCEYGTRRMLAYDAETGEQLWSRDGEYNSVEISTDGRIFALNSGGTGTIYGKLLQVFDRQGRMIREAPWGGWDLALDRDGTGVYLVGKTIQKLTNLETTWEMTSIRWCAVSADTSPDGTLWVAERDHPDVISSTNRIFQLSSSGQILKSVGLDFSPTCVRVNKRDGSVWVTGWVVRDSAVLRLLKTIEEYTGGLPLGRRLRLLLSRPWIRPATHQYLADGTLARSLDDGGHTLEIDPLDESLWIAGKEAIYHYSADGSLIGGFTGLPDAQRWIALRPLDAQRTVDAPPSTEASDGK